MGLQSIRPGGKSQETASGSARTGAQTGNPGKALNWQELPQAMSAKQSRLEHPGAEPPFAIPSPDAKRQFMDFLLESMPDQIYFKDRESRFTCVSRAVAEHLGESDPSHLIGKTDFDYFDEKTACEAFNDEQRIIATGQPVLGKVEQGTHSDGHLTWSLTTKVPLRDAAGGIIGIGGINKDITAIKEIEAALQAERNRLQVVTTELTARNAQLEADLQFARVLQEALLPRENIVFKDASLEGGGALAFERLYRPATVVGGDFFHIIPLPQDRAGVFICDVMGHGLRAALVTAIIRACLEELRPVMNDPGGLLRALNLRLRTILTRVEEPFVATAFYMVADPAMREVRFANAGHPHPVRMRCSEGAVETLGGKARKPGCALGLFDDAVYPTSCSPFEPHDRILLFTDGLYEAESPNGEEFGITALMESFRRHTALNARELFAAVLADVSRFSGRQDFDDDVCILALDQT